MIIIKNIVTVIFVTAVVVSSIYDMYVNYHAHRINKEIRKVNKELKHVIIEKFAVKNKS